MILRSHQYTSNVWYFSQFIYDKFRISKIQEIIINTSDNITVQTFKIISKNIYNILKNR